MQAWRSVGICVIAAGSISLAAAAQNQSATPPEIGQKAVSFVIARYALDGTTLVPKTGKPLPPSGKWAVSRNSPEACPETTDPCIGVFYNVAEADVSCKWTVLLPSDGSKSRVLTENDDAARYLVVRLGPDEAGAQVETRVAAVDPPIARAAHIVGDVVLLVVVNPDGALTRYSALGGPEMLKGAALSAGRRWRFKPYMVGDRAVRFQMELIFTFSGVGMQDAPVTMKP
jgi:TonB family protein